MSTVLTLAGAFGLVEIIPTQLGYTITAGNTIHPVHYSNWGINDNNVIDGVEKLDTAINSVGGVKVVFGHSLGALVAARWLNEHGPTSPVSPANLSFVLIGNPARRYGGFLSTDPLNAYDSAGNNWATIDLRMIPIDTPYDVSDLTRQYDGFGDYPADSTNLASVAAALTGMNLLHPFYQGVRLGHSTNTTYTEGNITYELAPTHPFWVPEALWEVIEAGYDRPVNLTPPPATPPISIKTPSVRYPSNPVTPHGAYQILRDRVPQVSLLSYDESVVFWLMGGLSIADRQTPERVELKSLKGLIPPWTTIDQKGATQDGTTFVDALYDPIEVELECQAHGRNPRETRKVLNHLIASLDVKKQSTLAWFTHELGRWWAPVRWFQSPASDSTGGTRNSQRIALRLRADTGFWQSYPDVAEYRFAYLTARDDFTDDDPNDLGTGWTINIAGAGSGGVFIEDGQVKSDLQDGERMVARKTGFTTATNNQVVEIQIGAFGEWLFPSDAGFDIWMRMGTATTPGQNGVRFRFQRHLITCSTFEGGVELNIRRRITIVPPLPGERFTVVAGIEANEFLGIPFGGERAFRVLRNGATLMAFKDSAEDSQLGAAFRGVGFGLFANGNFPPPWIQSFKAGDNSTVNQTGFIRRINAGDQDFWDTYTCFGPGTFRIGNGPGSEEMVEFGPLLSNQVMQIRSDPRKRGVVDLTSVPPTLQELNVFQKALQDIINFATGNNVPPLLQELESLFGILPPQGNPYTLMNGRFSNPIPAKSPGKPAVAYHVKVEIDDGNADSKIIAAGTPLRRNPF